MYIEAFTSHFGALTDARQSAKVTYPLEDILFITLCAVTAGSEGWSDIRMYADGHRTWFEELGFLQHGIPVDDTIARTISRVDPEQFRLCFVSWMQSIHEASQGQVIAIDGKTLRRSYQPGNQHSAIHNRKSPTAVLMQLGFISFYSFSLARRGTSLVRKPRHTHTATSCQ